MKRTYVFYSIFVAMAFAGIALLLGLAGGSDRELFSAGELLLFGGVSVALTGLGVYGARLCGEALRCRRHSRRGVLRALPAVGRGPEKAA